MIERHLSNHANTYLVKAEQRYDVALAAFDSGRAAQSQASASLAAAKRAKSWWKRLFIIQTDDERIAERMIDQHQQTIDEATKRIDRAKIDRAKAERGNQGEKALPELFGPRLSDQWIMYHGCYNNKGEIDHLVLGPQGLWAIEVKSERVELRVFGDDWRYTKLDNWGNRVGKGHATDGKGRSWGRQVAEPAQVLANRLASRGHDITIRTAVVLVDEQARIVDAVQPGVDLVIADLQEFSRVLTAGHALIDNEQLRAIDRLIVEHHQYFEKQ